MESRKIMEGITKLKAGGGEWAVEWWRPDSSHKQYGNCTWKEVQSGHLFIPQSVILGASSCKISPFGGPGRNFKLIAVSERYCRKWGWVRVRQALGDSEVDFPPRMSLMMDWDMNGSTAPFQSPPKEAISLELHSAASSGCWELGVVWGWEHIHMTWKLWHQVVWGEARTGMNSQEDMCCELNCLWKTEYTKTQWPDWTSKWIFDQ
jgi:hypothetical protein